VNSFPFVENFVATFVELPGIITSENRFHSLDKDSDNVFDKGRANASIK
jgi:hypothetical protein